jgi:hypothetical protein
MLTIRNTLLFGLLLIASTAISANDLLQNLTSQLGITTEQAAGGAGALFNMAKSQLSGDEFSQIAAAVPNIDTLMAAAPAITESTAGAVSSMIGSESGLGNLASLASSFSQLGLSSDMIAQFTPIVFDYLQQAGGANLMEMMKGALALP